MTLVLGLLLSLASNVYANAPVALTYEITTYRNGAFVGLKKYETVYILWGTQLWVELKKDRYYATYQAGTFYFFNLITGTRHPIQLKKSQKSFTHSTDKPNCKLHYHMIETSSPLKEQYDICLTESKQGSLPAETYVWLMDPTLSAVFGIDDFMRALIPQSIKMTQKNGTTIERVLLPEQPAQKFKDDTIELWKLPIGAPCTSRTCGQLI